MATPQEKIAALQAQTDLKNQAKARANLANVYGKVDAAANQSELANADKFVKTTGMTTLYNTTPTPTGYNPATATAGQQVAAQNLTNKGIDPTKVGTGTGNTFQPYQATQTPMSWEVVGKQKDPTQVSNYLNTQPGFKTSIVGNTVTGTKNGVNTTWIYDGANWVTKPTIATGDSPVIGNEPATNVVTTPGGFDTYEAMTPEQRYRKATEIYMKGGKDITDEEKKFMAYTQFQGATGKDVFGLKTTKSSGTTTYSTELVQPGENIASSVRNSDGTYKVTYKDGTTQITTSEPSTTVFPEGTPEYFAQKKAEEGEKRIQVLTEQVNKAEEKRKKDTAELVAKYGEDIATQLASQKAEIEANGAKRMEAAQSIYSFSGFGRSSLAAEKRDEIAKNIETTINQAKAKADLELMAYRMEREGADAEAISAMRTNIANVQTKIDDANYANQLEIIKLNQENATTGAEAMNNLLATISNADELMKDIDYEKSALHGYLVDKKTGKTMFDSQGRPIKFENSASGLEPNEIQTFSELLKTGKVDIEGLKKLGLNPAEIADISKDYAIQNNTYVPTAQGSGEYTMAKIFGKTVKLDTVAMPSFQAAMAQMPPNTVIGAQQFRTPEEQARLKAEGKSWTLDSNHMKGLAVDIYDGDPSRKPSAEQIAIMNKNGWYQDPALMAKGDYGHFDYKGVGNGGGSGQADISNLSKEAQSIIAQINSQGGKPTDYILGTSKDSQALLQEVLQGLNAQGGSGTLASETRTQSLDLAQKTIDELLANKDLAGSFQTRRVGDTGMGAIFNLTANENVNFVNRVDALAGQLMQIDGPTLKAIFGPQISNSDIEMIKKTILQGLDPRNQNPAAFEKTLNDVKAKMQAYINRLPQNQGTATMGDSNGTVGGESTVTNTNLIDSLR